MADRIGFYLDDGIDPTVAKTLRHYGIRVLSPSDSELRDRADLEQLLLACQKQLAIVTPDPALVRLARDQPSHFGLIYCDPCEPTPSKLIRRLILIYEVMSIDELMGKIEVL